MSVILFPLLALLALSLCIPNTGVGAAALPAPVPQDHGLVWHYYKRHNTCDDAEVYIRHQVETYWKQDRTIAPKLLRLVYSDCFVTGCDASILLDGPNSEKSAPQNRGLGGFALIDKIKAVLEDRCPGVVSCADILHLATRDAVHMAGAPSYPVFTGRKDGMTSSAASVDLPSPSISVEKALKYFQSKSLRVADMVTLLGAHSLGRTHCSFIDDRLYNFSGTGKPDRIMPQSFLEEMRKLCPPKSKRGKSDPLVFLNPPSGTKYQFNNTYYYRVLSYQGILGVDQQLVFNNDTKQMTEDLNSDFEYFRKSFAESMHRLGNIQVLTGNAGQIRRNCRYRNK